jgi:hypothetical protein
VIFLLKSLKNACSWVVSQVEAGINWVRDNRPTIQAKVAEMVQRAYEVASGHLREVVVVFERGMVIGIELVEQRLVMPFKEALAEVKSVVKAMTDEQVCAYTAFWFCQDAAQAIAV